MNPLKTDFLLLLLALTVGGTAAWYAGALELWVIGSAAIAFAITLVILMFFRQMTFARKIARIERGLFDYEASVNERFGRVSADAVSQKDIENLKRDLQVERITQKITRPPEIEPADPVSVSGEENVVPFLRLVRDNDAPGEEEQKAPGKAGPVNKRAITLYLQPVVNLHERRTTAFDIVPGFMNDEDRFLPLSENRDLLKGTISAARCDLILLEDAFSLLRSLDIEDAEIRFNLPISGGAIESKKLFKEFLRLLKLHDRFAGTLFLTMDQPDFARLNKAALSRLVEMLDSGFGLMLTDCHSAVDALLAVEEGHARGLSITMDLLEELEKQTGSEAELALLSQAVQADVPVAVTGVSTETHVMTVIDHSIGLASGTYFSGPKAPRTGIRGNKPAQA